LKSINGAISPRPKQIEDRMMLAMKILLILVKNTAQSDHRITKPETFPNKLCAFRAKVNNLLLF
jgi:hypothetical protein